MYSRCWRWAPASPAPPAAGSSRRSRARTSTSAGRRSRSATRRCCWRSRTWPRRAIAPTPRLPPVAEGLALIRKLRNTDKLPKLVVVALGSNGYDQPQPDPRRARHRRQEADARPGDARARPAAAPPATPTSSAARRAGTRTGSCCSTGSSTAPGTRLVPAGRAPPDLRRRRRARGPVQGTSQGSAEAALISGETALERENLAKPR